MLKSLIISCLMLAVNALLQQQHVQYTTPTAILKQIDRQNADGSYTYGYEGADKSFKIETKYPNGEVYGKYGYVDDQGKVREIEYGASKRGFEPAGSDINVPPPTLTSNNPGPLNPDDQDDGQYREDPSIYYKDQKYNRPVSVSKFSLSNFHQPKPQSVNYPQQFAPNAYQPPVPQFYNAAARTHTPQFAPTPQPQIYYQQPYHQQFYQPQQQYSQQQHLHPAVKSLDIWSGSYSLDYTGRR